MRNLHPIRTKPLQGRNHLLEMINILSMNNQVRGERNSMRANPGSQFNFVSMSPCPRNPVRGAFSRILKTELDMVKPSPDQLFQPFA